MFKRVLVLAPLAVALTACVCGQAGATNAPACVRF